MDNTLQQTISDFIQAIGIHHPSNGPENYVFGWHGKKSTNKCLLRTQSGLTLEQNIKLDLAICRKYSHFIYQFVEQT